MRALRLLFHASGATLSVAMTSVALTLGCLLFGLWLWVQAEGSLGQSLRLAARFLPAGQGLQVDAVSGRLQDGGRIGYLQWHDADWQVEAQGLELRWQWQPLLNRALRLPTVHLQSLQVQRLRPSANAAPGLQLPELLLPLQVDAVFAVDRLLWLGSPPVQVEALHGHYRFDGSHHSLEGLGLRMAQGSYQGQARLQARAPMAVALTLQGTVQTPLKVQQQALQLVADASAQGTLAGEQAQVEVRMSLLPQGQGGGQGKTRPLGAMQASLQAQIHPTQAQPLASGQAQWRALDLASVWPDAPHTSLAGEAQVQPDSAGWKADITLQNALAGAWDAHRLPLNSAQGQLLYRNGQWLLSSLQAAVAGGTVQAQGQYSGKPARWEAHATVKGLEPARIDSHWQFAPVQGHMNASDTGQGLGFELALDSSVGPGTTAQAVHLQTSGSWHAPTLQLASLQLQLPQASLSGQLQYNRQSQAASARLQASAPGASADIDGSLGETAGQGRGDLQISDLQALQRWLASQPAPLRDMAARVGPAQGSAQLALRWNGGWQQQGQALQVQVSLQSPGMVWQNQRLQALQLDLDGTLAALALQLRVQWQAGATQLALQAQAHGGQAGSGLWRASMDKLALQASNPLYTAPWTVDLRQPVALEWRDQAQGQALELAPGSLRLGGPATGTAQLQWQAARWAHPGPSGNGVAARWNTSGQLQGLPLAWLEVLGQTSLAHLGLRGDLLFGGQWEASATERLRMHARLERSSGDVQLLGSDPAAPALAAGIQDAHVSVDVEDTNLQASLVWASEAGGNAEASLATRLQLEGGSPRWAPDAPLQGKLHASLPRVGAWSLVAPVGWRIQGTLEADAVLSGSRNAPSWQGTAQARDMSVRSVVDGIDFSNGLMRLQFNGQHMEIAELVLQGAGGAAGGVLQITGSADWLEGGTSDKAAAGPAATAERLRMVLAARAQNFRISAKPDQRLVVSGNLNAQLNNARLVLRGALVADQALFVLPDDNALRLGRDVTVRRRNADISKPGAATGSPGAVAQGALPKSSARPNANANAKTGQKVPQQIAQTVQPDISVTLDPGPNFQLQGQGINTRLAGLLTLKAEGPNATPRLVGELHTVAGTYRAYGQNLNIEQGTLRFSGAYDNPALDIRALRPNLTQEVGVEISGTAQLPVVRLYSDPDLPDADKLSWLVLGHGAATGGAETAMLQQAALALLAGNGKSPTSNLVNAFGLDEVSLGQAATTNLDGSSGTETTVKLGKRISRDFYVAYERGLTGTFGTFYVFYDLSRRFTLRAESGLQSAVDLIFTTRFD